MEIMEKKLAIIIPYYKISFFEETLKSLEAQTDKRFKVYIGNDASPNNPQKLIEKYEAFFPLYYHRFSENLGKTHLVKQWARCINLAKNEDWLMILGDDDTLSENTVEEFYNHLPILEKENIRVARLASQTIDEQGKTISRLYQNPKRELAPQSYMRIFKGGGRSTLTEHFFLRKSYEKHGFKDFPVAFGSDVVAWLEFPDMGTIYGLNDAFANIRISNEHLSSKPDPVLRYKRHEGIYKFNRYIIQNYASYFSKEEQFLILKKAYKNLRSATRNKLEAIDFIWFIIKRVGIKSTWKIIQFIIKRVGIKSTWKIIQSNRKS